MTRIIGCDPGITGALALLERGGQLVDIKDMPVVDGQVDAYALTDIIAGWGQVDRVVVETQQAMPRQGVSSTFKTGANYGRILGVLAALQRPVTHVRAAEWTKALRVGPDKAVHRRRAMDEWPATADRFARVKDDGRADAALIAMWAATRAERIRGAA
jgi:crossover junction endodeoxyribonuclease RuvC